jgi:hypothetical protein
MGHAVNVDWPVLFGNIGYTIGTREGGEAKIWALLSCAYHDLLLSFSPTTSLGTRYQW